MSKECKYFEQTFQHDVWALIKASLPCFEFRSGKFHLIHLETKKTLKSWDSRSPDELLKYMLKEGIPYSDSLALDVIEELTKEIVLSHVPKADLTSARCEINGFSKSDIRTELSNEEILKMLKTCGFCLFRGDNTGLRIYKPHGFCRVHDGKHHGEHFFRTLEETRNFVRANENLAWKSKRIRNQDPKMMLQLRIWAATSPDAIPHNDVLQMRAPGSNPATLPADDRTLVETSTNARGALEKEQDEDRKPAAKASSKRHMQDLHTATTAASSQVNNDATNPPPPLKKKARTSEKGEDRKPTAKASSKRNIQEEEATTDASSLEKNEVADPAPLLKKKACTSEKDGDHEPAAKTSNKRNNQDDETLLLMHHRSRTTKRLTLLCH